jgi:hypothetical protein
MLVTSLAGGVMSAVGTGRQYAAASANAAYQAQVAANNAKIAQQNQNAELQAGSQQATMTGLRTRATVGKTKAEQGASNVDVNSGSFSNARSGEAEVGLLDALTVRSNAARRAYGYEVQGLNDTAQSQLLETESRQAREAEPWAVGASLLSSASSAGSRYAMYQMNSGG